jgi:subtilisin family serine protease
VAAPGCNETTALGSSYEIFCGTSSSTPLVAGAVALLRSAGATRTQAEQALMATALPEGYVASGRIDVAAALASLATGTSSGSGGRGSGGGNGGGNGGGPKPR